MLTLMGAWGGWRLMRELMPFEADPHNSYTHNP